MIETKSRTHTTRIFATRLSFLDIFKVVQYHGYRGDANRIPFYYSKCHGHTCITDLTLSMDDIMAQMKSNTRNEIRRAIKEGCEFSVTKDIDFFVKFYNDFCDGKGLNDYSNRARLEKYSDLLLTQATHNGKVLAMHANLLDPIGKNALLILSCSQRFDADVDKKMIGWGNRFLHFKDLEYLKENGYTYYDWSGVVLDPDDERYSIGQFKLAFGGKVIESLSLTSPLFAMLNRVRNRIVKYRK